MEILRKFYLQLAKTRWYKSKPFSNWKSIDLVQKVYLI